MRIIKATIGLCLLTQACGGESSPAAVSEPDGADSCPASQAPFGTNAEAGESFPDLTLADCGGERVTVADARCQSAITLLSFGAGWCQPCREEAPQLESAWQHLKERDVSIVQVLFQDGSALPATTQFCQGWTDQFSLTVPVYIDPVQNSLELFDVAGTPLNVIIDRSGKVLWSQSGKIDDVEATLEPFIP